MTVRINTNSAELKRLSCITLEFKFKGCKRLFFRKTLEDLFNKCKSGN